jgi:hypothetical protein
MAAFPFGGYPTFGQYVERTVQQGCTVKRGVVVVEGEPYSVTRIFNPPGKKWVTEIETHYTDFLVPTTVGRFDRRLGLRSPFFSLDFREMDPGKSYSVPSAL